MGAALEPPPRPRAAPDSTITDSGIGPVRLAMSESDLIGLFGPDAVVRHDSYVGEGYCAPGSRVFPDRETEIEVQWSDRTYAVIASLALGRPDSPWRTPAGVRIGSTLKELESLAGQPIQFGGFGWDYGGGATWSEGDLSIGLRLGATPESEAEVRADPRFPELLGERTVRSDHPVARRLDIVVERIYLRGPGRPETEYECG